MIVTTSIKTPRITTTPPPAAATGSSRDVSLASVEFNAPTVGRSMLGSEPLGDGVEVDSVAVDVVQFKVAPVDSVYHTQY